MSYGSTPPPNDGGYQAPPPPPMGAYNAGAPPPPNNLVLAILSTVLCCLPIGIYAIILASKVNTLWAQGDVAGAQKASADAKRWALIGAVLGLVGSVIIVVLQLAAAGSTSR